MPLMKNSAGSSPVWSITSNISPKSQNPQLNTPRTQPAMNCSTKLRNHSTVTCITSRLSHAVMPSKTNLDWWCLRPTETINLHKEFKGCICEYHALKRNKTTTDDERHLEYWVEETCTDEWLHVITHVTREKLVEDYYNCVHKGSVCTNATHMYQWTIHVPIMHCMCTNGPYRYQ